MGSIFGCRLLSAVTSFPVIGKVVIKMFNDNFAPKQRLAESVNTYVRTSELSKEDILKILSHIPTRGCDPGIPTYELLSHAALSGAMYAEAFEAYKDIAASAYVTHVDIIHTLDDVIDMIVNFGSDDLLLREPDDSRMRYVKDGRRTKRAH